MEAESVTGSFSASHGTIILKLYLGYSGPQEYSIYGLQSHWKRSFANRTFPETFGPKASFLLTTFSRAPRSSALPVEPVRYALHKQVHRKVFVPLPRRDGSQEQAVVRKSAHILLGLIFCSGEEGRWKQGIKPFAYDTVYVQKTWFHSKEGQQYLSVSCH